MSLQESPDEKEHPKPYVIVDNVKNPPTLSVEEQMDATGVFVEEKPTLTGGEKAAPAAQPQVPEVKIAPDQIATLQEPGRVQTLKEALPNTVVGDMLAALNRAGIGIASEPFIAAYETFYQWRHGRTVQKEVKLLGFKKEVESTEEKLGQVTAAIEQSKKDGTYTAGVAKLYEREKDGYIKGIEKLKTKVDTARDRWEKSSNKDAYWRNKQKQVAEGAKATLEEKARPYQHTLEEQRAKYAACEAIIERYRTNKEVWTTGLRKLESKLADKQTSDGEKAMLTVKIDRIKEIFADAGKIYNAELEQSRRIAMKMNATNRRISRWQGMSNEMTRVGSRPHQPGEHEAVKEGGAEPRHGYNFSHEAEAEVPKVPAPQESAEALQVRPDVYIKKWNELFKANGADINIKAFTDSYRMKPSAAVDAKNIEDNIIKMFIPGVPLQPQKDIFEEGMRARFKTTREALKKQS